MLVQFDPDPAENFTYAVGMEAVKVPLDAILNAAYFALSMADTLLLQPTLAQGATNIDLPQMWSNFRWTTGLGSRDIF
jgi:hypothetical protein